MNVLAGAGTYNWVSQSSYQQARNILASKQANGNMNARSIQNHTKQMFSNWNVSMRGNMEPFQGHGNHNIAIHPDNFRRMAEDPEYFVGMTALFQDIKNTRENMSMFPPPAGTTRVASGTIVDADGNISGWSIIKSSTPTSQSATERRSLFTVPESNRASWAELMRNHLEGIGNTDRNNTGNWMA